MYNNYICHFGIKGQKWGVRRFQNEDGSLKPAGEGRYNQTKEIGDRFKEHLDSHNKHYGIEVSLDKRFQKDVDYTQMSKKQQHSADVKAGLGAAARGAATTAFATAFTLAETKNKTLAALTAVGGLTLSAIHGVASGVNNRKRVEETVGNLDSFLSDVEVEEEFVNFVSDKNRKKVTI